MDYLTATRTVARYTCKCGSLLSYRINEYGDYKVFCSADREHAGWIPQPTNQDVWAESFKRQAEIMKGKKGESNE